VISVSGTTVNDLLDAEGGEPSQAQIDASELRFFKRTASAGFPLVELAPYFATTGQLTAHGPIGTPTGYTGSSPQLWRLERPSSPVEEQVTVPAGTFKTLRIDVSGAAAPSTNTLFFYRFAYTIWYAPEVRRYVKARHRFSSQSLGVIADQVVELMEYRPK
jgi:hypothetical protein